MSTRLPLKRNTLCIALSIALAAGGGSDGAASNGRALAAKTRPRARR